MTLIGVLIGITILTIALAAQIRLLSNTLKRQAYLRNSIIATNLAREGIEIAFLARSTIGWDALKTRIGSDLCTDIGNVQTLKIDGVTCNSTTLNYAENDTFKGFYYDNQNIITGLDIPAYWRVINVKSCGPDENNIINDNQCLILSTKVGWDKETISLEKKIYNWYIP